MKRVEEIIIRYLNRLSDYLFVLARKQGFDLGDRRSSLETKGIMH
jgi:cob(I)alamin adenosyltransferase